MKSNKISYAAITLLFISGVTNVFAGGDGYMTNGYGVKASGMGGTGIAFPQDGLAAANNPAGTGLLDDQINVGLTIFSVPSGAEIVGNSIPGANGSYDGSETKIFYGPELGYIKKLSNSMSFGFAVYGNGGGSDYKNNNPFGAFGGGSIAGATLTQMILKPSIAYKLNEQNTFGVGLNILRQRIAVNGLQGFQSQSVRPQHVTNNGNDWSNGLGLHLGWIGQITPALSLGVSWSSKVYAKKFNDYDGLLADGGSFDTPVTYGVGLAYKIAPDVNLTADYKKIKFSGIPALSNPLSNLFAGNLLGASNGPGFGWKDVSSYKVGASYDLNPELTLRMGFNHLTLPAPSDQTLLNIYVPIVVKNNLSLGATWKTSAVSDWSGYYLHGFSGQQNGVNSIPATLGGGNANTHLMLNYFGVAYTRKL